MFMSLRELYIRTSITTLERPVDAQCNEFVQQLILVSLQTALVRLDFRLNNESPERTIR